MRRDELLAMVWAIDPAYVPQLVEASRLVTEEPEREAVADSRRLGDGPLVMDGGVAVIDIRGILTKGGGSLFFPGTSMIRARRDVMIAASDPDVAGILLRVDSPGGTVAGTGALADAVYEARQAKPVWAHGEDLVASAAYWVGSQADRLFANRPEATVGSIGVVGVIRDWSKALEDMGVKTHVIRTGEFKGAGAMGEKITQRQLGRWQSEFQDTHREFITAIERGRGMSRSEVEKVADGATMVASRAVKAGLIDGVQPIEATIQGLLAAAGSRGRQAVAMSGRQAITKGSPMTFNKHQLALMRGWGLAEDATPEAVDEFYGKLTAEQTQLVEDLKTVGQSAEPKKQSSTPERVDNAREPAKAEAPATASPPAQGRSDADIERAIDNRLEQEASRRRAIEDMISTWEARGYEDLDGLRREMLDDRSISAGDAARRLMSEIPKRQPRPQVSVGMSQGEKFTSIADQTILSLAGVESEYVYVPDPSGVGHTMRKDPERARKQREAAESDGVLAMGLQGLMRQCLANEGRVRNPHLLNGQQLFQAYAATGMNLSSGDFPLILEAAANKVLMAGYAGASVTYPTWCFEGGVRNFQTHKKLKLSEAPLLKKRLEGAPAQHGTFAEERETYSAEEWALAVALTRKMIIDDDVMAFTDMARDLGQAIPDTVEVEVWDVMLSNAGVGPTMGDGVAMFHEATHGNLAGSGAAPGDATLKSGITDMANQTGFGQDGSNRPLGIMPRYFLGSMTDYWEAAKVIQARFATDTEKTETPQFVEIANITPVHVPQLTIRSERDWYLTGPKQNAPIQVSYLNNVRAPRLRRNEGTTISGIMWLIEFDVGVNAIDWRTAYRNPGA